MAKRSESQGRLNLETPAKPQDLPLGFLVSGSEFLVEEERWQA